MPTIYIVATPLGNLEDFSRRAERILREVDLILSEDTRVTRKLLRHFEIQKPLLPYHVQSPARRTQEILDLLAQGKNLALVSDAGTPGINDPGGALIAAVVRRFGHQVKIAPIPGPSIVAAALSVSGFPAEHFTYLGFPPHRKGREKFFRRLAELKETVVFLESPYRILKALASLEELMPDRELMIGRELTKIYETIYRGQPKEVTDRLKSGMIKGELVVVLAPLKKKKGPDEFLGGS